MNGQRIFLLFFLMMCASAVQAYTVITPEPFSIVGKNYCKLQLLAEQNDPTPDSVFFDIVYNTGARQTVPVDKSLSCVITLNQFNDGVFFVKARVYNGAHCTTLAGKYDAAGIPVMLDRHAAPNEAIYKLPWLGTSKTLQTLPAEHGYDFAFNNNKAHFAGGWNQDSLYFIFTISDAHLNAATPGLIDLFQAKQFLKTLWMSDCIELGFDLQHDRTVWKGKDDYELLVDLRNRFAGNRWSTADSLYTHWGDHTKVNVLTKGSINDNQDTDEGYVITISIPWSELNYAPVANQAIGFDVQLYDKDGELDNAFRTSISGTNPESNDNTSEWATMVLEAKPQVFSYSYLLLLLPLIALAMYWYYVKRKKQLQPAPALPVADPLSDTPQVYSPTIQKALEYITARYTDADLSRQQIAEQVFISEKYLSSLFKKEVGTNLVTYINELRIRKAVELLQDTRLPVADIAFSVGYNSLQNFNKNFRAITQQSPSGYRRS